MFSRKQYVNFSQVKENKRNNEIIRPALFCPLTQNIKFSLKQTAGRADKLISVIVFITNKHPGLDTYISK